MGKGLAIEDKTLAFLHGIVDIEIPHAKEIFINVQLTQIPKTSSIE